MYNKNYIKEMTQLLTLKGFTPGTVETYQTCMNKVLTFLADRIINYDEDSVTFAYHDRSDNNRKKEIKVSVPVR
jgi:hypothetical protein